MLPDVGWVSILGFSTTFIVISFKFSELHTPFFTSALYCVVVVRLFTVYVLSEWIISVHVVPFTELCHVIVPVWPLKVNKVLFVPEQTVAPPEIVPPTLASSTFIVPVALKPPHPPDNGIL